MLKFLDFIGTLGGHSALIYEEILEIRNALIIIYKFIFMNLGYY